MGLEEKAAVAGAAMVVGGQEVGGKVEAATAQELLAGSMVPEMVEKAWPAGRQVATMVQVCAVAAA